ncbi:hypothetical protein JYU20_04315 [Bacteroidales bacterium AH-315-I05]|nr:hypothetical protein [Bacteroidales bacterium AH-315-I05]
MMLGLNGFSQRLSLTKNDGSRQHKINIKNRVTITFKYDRPPIEWKRIKNITTETIEFGNEVIPIKDIKTIQYMRHGRRMFTSGIVLIGIGGVTGYWLWSILTLDGAAIVGSYFVPSLQVLVAGHLRLLNARIRINKKFDLENEWKLSVNY